MKQPLDATESVAANWRWNERAMMPVCPKCDVGLFILKFKSVEVDYCEHCRGIWLDAGELEHLLADTGATANDPFLNFQNASGTLSQDGSKHLCPRCDQRLHEIVVGNDLTLDRCPTGHGLWFDADELQQLLARFPASAGAGKTIRALNDIFSQSPKTSNGGKHP